MVDCVLQPSLEICFVDDLREAFHMRGTLDFGSFATRIMSHLLAEHVEQEVGVLGEPLVVESQHALYQGFTDRLASTEDLHVVAQREQIQSVTSNVSCRLDNKISFENDGNMSN